MSGLAQENLEIALEAINSHSDELNCLVTPTTEQAKVAAAAADKVAAEGAWPGLLYGMTMAIKDNIDTAGIRTTSGSLHFKDMVPNQDAFVIERLRLAGAVIVGKAAMQEFGFGVRTFSPVSGQCHNPWDRSRIPGGSSGDSGVTVAVGIASASLGCDTGGSVRLPAAINGIAGLRPTHGRVPNHGATPISASYDTIGPMARNVSDLARILAVISNEGPSEAPTSATSLGNFLPTLNDGISGLRIGVPRNHYFVGCDDDIAEATMNAIRVLERQGAHIIDVDVDGAKETQDWYTIQVYSDACAFHENRIDEHPELFEPQVLERMLVGRNFTGVDYANACRAREGWQRSLATLYQDIDILASPTTPQPPAFIDDDKSLLEATKAASHNTYAGGFGANPGLSLPSGFDRNGLPTGLQLEAAWWEEPMLLRAGITYQAATEWHLATPSLI